MFWCAGRGSSDFSGCWCCLRNELLSSSCPLRDNAWRQLDEIGDFSGVAGFFATRAIGSSWTGIRNRGKLISKSSSWMGFLCNVVTPGWRLKECAGFKGYPFLCSSIKCVHGRKGSGESNGDVVVVIVICSCFTFSLASSWALAIIFSFSNLMRFLIGAHWLKSDEATTLVGSELLRLFFIVVIGVTGVVGRTNLSSKEESSDTALAELLHSLLLLIRRSWWLCWCRSWRSSSFSELPEQKPASRSFVGDIVEPGMGQGRRRNEFFPFSEILL